MNFVWHEIRGEHSQKVRRNIRRSCDTHTWRLMVMNLISQVDFIMSGQVTHPLFNMIRDERR